MQRKFDKDATNRPAIKSKAVDALDTPVAQPDDITFPASGSIDGVRETVIEPVADLYGFKEKAAALAFNEEILEVMISESNEQNPEHYVFLKVNGRGAMPNNVPWVPRGVPVKIARKYVERLCRAKPVNIRTVEARDMDGALTTRIHRTSALKYPFSVIYDPNPKGRAWLSNLLSQA